MLNIFMPIALLIKVLGFKGVIWLTLLTCLSIFVSTFYISAFNLIFAFVIFLYLLSGIAFISSRQIKGIESVIEHINTKDFDHRDVHFNCLVNSDFIDKLLVTYR